jgi:tetratricopeptide (TPR) repeat protein
MTSSSMWRSRPVFITSTFRDMHAERDWLRVHVFPVLEERLRARFHHLETIDLRWGVESASADEEQDRERVVLTVCLREIERSRPFLIGLLGDRYGWRPPGARIADAAREAGLNADLEGKSVTELEILYGVLRGADQQRRSWFYLRNPLPYDTMPATLSARYSDAHSGESDGPDNARKLEALKARLTTALPARVRRYSAQWNPDAQCVTGLESWGAQVLDDLWGDLEAETAAFLREAPESWQGQDRWALDEFIEGHVRGFVGRTNITNELVALALSRQADGVPWGACVTAQAGAGKSSLFGHLYGSLQEKDVLVLAHAAGISVRSTQVDWMLRRWVAELAEALGQADPLDDTASPADIDQAFSRLLHQASHARRVVVLIDALNQFEPTTRATHLTWLPRLWPANARLIATAIPGTQSASFLHRPGCVERALPPIDRHEAIDIVRGICARYHRTLNTRVENALLDKAGDDQTPAFGNPLWLELATEELNLLGAEAFERTTATPGAEGIVTMLVSVVAQMPADIEGLYGWMLDRAEQHLGVAWARAFVNAITVSRAGWRESDLERLLPVLSGEAWDSLRFATLRRAFRAHVVQRGAHAQWDFSHAQMRKAVEQRLADENVDARRLHRVIGDHLVQLPREDPLHESETMVHLMHLMQKGSAERAASYYGSELTMGEARGATAVLASLAISADVSDVLILLFQRIDNSRLGRIGHRVLFELKPALEHSASLNVRRQLAWSVAQTFQRLIHADPRHADWQRDLSLSHEWIGDVRIAQGELPGALTAYQAAHAILERLTLADPGNAYRQEDLAVSHLKIGDALRAHGNLPDALTAYQSGHATFGRLASTDPSNGSWQLELCGSYQRIGDMLTAQGNLTGALTAYQASLAVVERLAAADPRNASWQSALSASHSKIGDVLSAQGNLPDALTAHRASHAIDEQLAASDPGNAGWQQNLSTSHNNIGDLLITQGNLAGALTAYQAGLSIRERLAAADPGNNAWQHDLSVSYNKIGIAFTAQGNLQGALTAHKTSHAIAGRLAAADPGNADWQHDFSVTNERIGDLFTAHGNLPGALTFYRFAHAIRERFIAADPDDASWQRSLSVSHNNIGNVLRAQGHLPGALTAYQASHAIAEQLAARHPGNADWQRDLSVSHNNIGAVLTAQGDLPGALKAHQASLSIAERLAASEPVNAEWQGDLSVCHERIGDVLTAQGNLLEALTAYQASHTIADRLAAADMANSSSQRDLAVSHIKIGDVLTAQSNLPGALNAFQASLAICERLAAADPENPGWQRDLSVSHGRIAEVLTARGNLPGALTAYQASLAICERLAAADPDNAGWQHDVAVRHNKLGHMLTMQRCLSEALTAYRASLAIFDRLAATDPGNTDLQRDLAVSHNKVGDVLVAQGNLPEALTASQASLATVERLAAADPANAGWQRDLAVNHIKVGDVLTAQGNLPGALTAYQAALGIAERLAATDPGNADLLRVLSVSHETIGDVLSAQGDLSGALTASQASLAARERLAATEPGNARWRRGLAVSHIKVGDVLTAQRNLPGALSAYQASLAIAEPLAMSDPGNVDWQRDLVVLYYNLASHCDRTHDATAPEYWRRCHEALGRMRANGMFLDPPLVQLLEQLDGSNSV